MVHLMGRMHLAGSNVLCQTRRCRPTRLPLSWFQPGRQSWDVSITYERYGVHSRQLRRELPAQHEGRYEQVEEDSLEQQIKPGNAGTWGYSGGRCQSQRRHCRQANSRARALYATLHRRGIDPKLVVHRQTNGGAKNEECCVLRG